MNNLLKLKNSQRQINILRMFGTQSLRLCAIALIAAIGFSFAACENGTTDDNNNDKTITRLLVDPTDSATVQHSYRIGDTDTLNLTDLKARKLYSDGSSEEEAVTLDQYELTGYDLSKAGYYQATLKHKASGVTSANQMRILVFPAPMKQEDLVGVWIEEGDAPMYKIEFTADHITITDPRDDPEEIIVDEEITSFGEVTFDLEPEYISYSLRDSVKINETISIMMSYWMDEDYTSPTLVWIRDTFEHRNFKKQ